MFTDMLYADVVRGRNSTGVFKIVNGKSDWRKAAVPAWEFFDLQGVETFFQGVGDVPFIVGHNRAATKGAIKNDNAHPFEVGHITLVHNGTLFTTHNLPGRFDVDSHAICNAIAAMGVEEASEKLNGPYSLVWYDSQKKNLNFLRNKDRPMWLGHHKDFIIFGSEQGLIRWVAGRYGFALDKVEETEVHKVYSFQEGSGDLTVATVNPYRFQQSYAPAWVGGGYGTNFDDGLEENWGVTRPPVCSTAPQPTEKAQQPVVFKAGSVIKLRTKAEKLALMKIEQQYKKGDTVTFSVNDFERAKTGNFCTVIGDLTDNKQVIVKGNFGGAEDDLWSCKKLLSGVITQVVTLRQEDKVMLFLKEIKISDIDDPFFLEKPPFVGLPQEDIVKTVLDAKACSKCKTPFGINNKPFLTALDGGGWRCLCKGCKFLDAIPKQGEILQ